MIRAGDILKTKSRDGKFYYSFVVNKDNRLYLVKASILHRILFHIGIRNIIWNAGITETMLTTTTLNDRKLAIVKDQHGS